MSETMMVVLPWIGMACAAMLLSAFVMAAGMAMDRGKLVVIGFFAVLMFDAIAILLWASPFVIEVLR